MATCPNGHKNVKELLYYYDDDWGYKGSKVWFGNCQATLYVCPICHTVFVDNIIPLSINKE